ncbi:MAG: YdcF family protein [Bacteroidota bacterium]|nr:YdcF family protein [Bacteroidota bacterium]
MKDTTTEYIPKPPSVRRLLAKRALLMMAGIVEVASHYVLTNARYLGQGLTPQFLRFSTRSDIISNALFLFIVLLTGRALLDPSRMSFLRTAIVIATGFIIFWITLGAKNFEVAEFPRVASIAYLLTRSLFLSLLLPRKEYNFSRISGALRVLKNTLLTFSGAVLFAFIFSFTYEVTSDFEEMRRFDADAAVILGAAVWHGTETGDHASPTLLERIKLGEQLFKQNIIPKIVTTGSNAPGEQAEGDIAKIELVKRGVDESKIISEVHSHSTLEQILYLRDELMTKQGWKKFIIVSDQYHLARALEICKFNNVEALGTPSGIKQSFLDLGYYRLRESVALLAYWILGK